MSAEMASDGEPSAVVIPTRSVLETFLALRSIPPSSSSSAAAIVSPSKRATRNAASSKSAAAGGSAPQSPARTTASTAATPLPVWRYFRKRVHGERVAALRAAMRARDDDFRLSRDAYNPTKLPTRFVKLHEEAEDVSTAFRVRTRALFFEREQVDRDVCDRLENRAQYDAQLAEIYSQD